MFFIGVFTQVLSYFRAEKTPRVISSSNTDTKIKTKSENLVQKVQREIIQNGIKFAVSFTFMI